MTPDFQLYLKLNDVNSSIIQMVSLFQKVSYQYVPSFPIEWHTLNWISHICWPFHGILHSSYYLLDNFGPKVHICMRLVETSLLYVLLTSWHHSVAFKIENWVTNIELIRFVGHLIVFCILATIYSITLEWKCIFVWHLLKRVFYMYCGQVDIIQFPSRLKIEWHTLN